jgi:GxxExxY protein
MVYELSKRGVAVQRQVLMPIRYRHVVVDGGYRLDLLVEQRVVVELKTVDRFNDVHFAQLLSYLRLGGFGLGYLLNFNVRHMKSGIKRIVN